MASIKKRGENTYLTMTKKQQEKEITQIAMRFEDEVKVQNITGSSVTFETFTNRWLKEHAETQLELKTISSYKKELSSKIIPAIGHVKLNKLQPMHLAQFYNKLTQDGVRQDNKSGGYSTRTIKYCHQIISSILTSAVQWNILQENIAKRVKPPKGIPKSNKINYFDDKQTMIFLKHIESEPLKYRLLANIAIYGGLRLEEILPLLWSDVDFECYTIDINKTTSYVDGKQFIKDTTKNKGSTRKIILPSHIFTLLK